MKRIMLFIVGLFFAYGMLLDVQASEIIQSENNAKIYEKEFGQDFYLSGLYDKCTAYFNVGKWDIKQANITLELNASQLLNREVCYYTVYVNNQPVLTTVIDDTNTRQIELPKESLMLDQVNSISVEAYLRGQTTDACVDDSSISTWMNIFSDSKIAIEYNDETTCKNIAEFYDKFSSIEALTYKESKVGTSAEASNGANTSMAYVLMGVSQGAKIDYNNIEYGWIDGTDTRNYPYIIYIDNYENLSDSICEKMTLAQKGYAEESAVVCLINTSTDSKKRYMLLITGVNEEALVNAGKMLTNSDYMKQLKGDTKRVPAQDDFDMPENIVDEYILLTSYGSEIRGNFKQSASFTVDYPDNRTIAQGSQLSLDFRYAQNLDFEKSLITVNIDGVPIGSRKLSIEGADDSSELFNIPQDLELVGGFTVEVIFDLYVADDWCQLTPEEIPWGYIENTSMLKLTSVDQSDLLFENFPSPFLRDGMLNNLKIVLPQKLEEEDVQIMSGILLTLGRFLKSNQGNMEVIRYSNEMQLENSNVIVIGRESDVKDKLLMDNGFAKRAGVAQLGYSPYGETINGILYVFGERESGMLQTLSYLGDAGKLWEVTGDVMVTDGEELFCYYYNDPIKESEIPVERSEEYQPNNISLIILGSVLVLGVFAILMVAIKHGRKDEDEE